MIAGYYKLHQHKEKVSTLANQDFANIAVTYKLGSMENETLHNLASNYNLY